MIRRKLSYDASLRTAAATKKHAGELRRAVMDMLDITNGPFQAKGVTVVDKKRVAGISVEKLYLQTDPGEQHNLVADPAYAEARRELRDQLLEMIVRQDYPKTRRELFALGVH